MKTNTYDDLYDAIRSYLKESNALSIVENAFHLAEELHANDIREDNTPYIDHLLRLGMILTEINADEITLAAAFLHGAIYHKKITKEDLANKTNNEIAIIADNVATINRLELSDEKESSAVYLRKVLVGLSEDVRVIFIKLADQLDNMRTIWVNNSEKYKLKAKETEDVLIPIAHRLGMNVIKSQLEDICLLASKPDIYKDIEEQLKASKNELENILSEMQDTISEILNEHDLNFSIKSRVKSIYSIYKKLAKGRKWKDIYDILALRIFVDKVSDCYLVIGLIHSQFRPIPNRFKDYIAMPKENMYQSLHTTVFGIDGFLFEIQVRTYEMDEIAEKGIASHWSYKENGAKKIQTMMEQKLEMFRALIETNDNASSDAEFAKNVKNEFFSDYIYIFTPQGDVVELPKGATPIDFAYRIHTDVGDHIVGALVNDQIVPLDHELCDEDIVKINTSASATPKRQWLNIVKTTQAKNKIKSYFSKQDRAFYIEKGKLAIENELRKEKYPVSFLTEPANLEKVLKELKLKDINDIYLAVGALRYTPIYIINLITAEPKDITDMLLEKMAKPGAKTASSNDTILVSGLSNIKVTLAKCCSPVKGDDIIGYVTKGDGVSIHRQDCMSLKGRNKRFIPVSWNEETEERYVTNIIVKVENDKNRLLDIITLASKKNVNIDKISSEETNQTILYYLSVKVKNTMELQVFIDSLKLQNYVMNVERGKK